MKQSKEHLTNEYEFPEDTYEPTKYLKVYQGRIAGRGDGFLEEKRELYNSIEELVADFGREVNEKYYELKQVPNSQIFNLVKEHRLKQEEAENDRVTKEIQHKVNQIKSQLEQVSDENLKKELEYLLENVLNKFN